MPSSPNDFTHAEIGRYVNDAYRDFVRDTKCLETQFWFEVNTGDADYELPDNMEMIQRVTHRNRKIPAVSVAYLDRLNEEWEDEAGEIDAYTITHRNERSIRTYRTPDYQNKHNLGYYGVVSYILDDQENYETDYQFRFASLVVSLGVVGDYEVTGETVTFEAAANGGGSDADYGLVVDITDDTDTGLYSFDDDEGVLVDVVDSSATAYDDLIFEGGGESTADTEYGLVIKVSSSVDTYLMNNQEGVNHPAPTDELGEVQWWKSDDEILEVWANETPPDMVLDTDEPRTPAWTHLAIAYGAAVKALTKIASTRDVAVASAYANLAMIQGGFVKKMALNSTKEVNRGFGQSFSATRRIRRGPRLPGEYPRWR